MPTGRLRARLTSMADNTGIAIIAADPACTSKWGAQHWQTPLTSDNRKTTRHDAAAVAIGRRAQGHPIRRRTAPPHDDRSDRRGHRTVQARPAAARREEPAPAPPDHAQDALGPDAERTRGTSVPNTVRGTRLSMGSGNRIRSRSVSRNGLHIRTGVLDDPRRHLGA
ncbi:hypothetical protein [Acrocarpospora pleiomorpha]